MHSNLLNKQQQQRKTGETEGEKLQLHWWPKYNNTTIVTTTASGKMENAGWQ